MTNSEKALALAKIMLDIDPKNHEIVGTLYDLFNGYMDAHNKETV